jgi:hypothetical protein
LAFAANPKEPTTALDFKAFFKPDLYISTGNTPLETALPNLTNRSNWESFLTSRGENLANPTTRVYIDHRSGAVSNFIESVPLIPGSGDRNRVTLASLGAAIGREVEAVDASAVEAAVRKHIALRGDLLGIDRAQLGAARVTQISADLWQISIPQAVNGVQVRDGRFAATISHGNLVLMGTETWGDVRGLDVTPTITGAQALEAGFAYADGRGADDVVLRAPQLEIIPFAPAELQQGEAFAGSIGEGYGHRLAWTWSFQRRPDDATWEVMVDAHSGELLAFQDINSYITKQITGGVYPLTNTGICPDADHCGTMQSGWPMPFADTGFLAPNNFTNSAGLYNYTSGTALTTLSGRFVDIVDTCGAIANSSATGDINLGGANGQHDCTSGGGSPGNTPASRTAFYETNKLIEQAKGYLPGNAWMNQALTANVNIPLTCNAFWNGVSINFYRSGGGCGNTGEIAAVFDHEWGHGLDDNDANGTLSNSSEGYADIAGIFRLEASCVGHGFFVTSNRGCGTTPDGTGFNQNEAQTGPSHCDTDCSGVRDADWAKHADNTPDTALGFVCNSCLASSGPCGRQVHCAAATQRQAGWDLVTRDLTAAPFGLDSQSAFIVGNRLFYQGSGNIGLWYACTCGGTSNGCAATAGYMQWLTADDDNGNLNDGTPHMTALSAAFNRHGIGCSTPTPTNSGCAGGPSAAVTGLTATPGDNSVGLTWSSVAGATRYWVYRSEGHAGCNFGKALVGTVTGLSFNDPNVANGRTYYYNVVPAGASNACHGPAGSCLSVTPAPGGTPDFTLSCSPSSLSVPQGSSGNSTCTVASQNAFSSAVSLDCASLPAGVTCSYSPNPVTPPANGSVNSGLTVTVGGGVATGTYSFQARGTSGALVHTFNMTLQVAGAGGDFTLSAAPPSQTVSRGDSTTYTVTVTPTGGFNGTVTFSASGLPRGVSTSFNPPSVGGSGSSVMTVTTRKNTPKATHTLTIVGTSGALTRTTTVQLVVIQ